MQQSTKYQVPEEFKDYFYEVFSDCWAIMVERQGGYGPTNIEALGPHGVFSRLASDKCARVWTSMNGTIDSGKVNIEDWYDAGVKDALIDIINYAAIMIALGEGAWSKVARGEHVYRDSIG
jgi:hypothetical protein